MKLRFEVDQAEAFRQGVDCPKSIVTVEANPSELPVETRHLLADRLEGIDVLQMFFYDGELIRGHAVKELLHTAVEPRRIVASAPTLDALISAVRANDRWIKQIQATFNRPVQLGQLQSPPANEKDFWFISTASPDWLKEVETWLEKGQRVVFNCFLDDVQTRLNSLLNAKSYRVYLLPVPGSTAQGRFFCERVFSAQFSGNKIVTAHSPTIVYDERRGNVVEAGNLFHALAIYLFAGITPGRNLNDIHILRWEADHWTIVSPEGLIDAANRVKKESGQPSQQPPGVR